LAWRVEEFNPVEHHRVGGQYDTHRHSIINLFSATFHTGELAIGSGWLIAQAAIARSLFTNDQYFVIRAGEAILTRAQNYRDFISLLRQSNRI
jgi:hypothetical protein